MKKKPVIEDENVIEISDLYPEGELVSLQDLLEDFVNADKGDRWDALEDLMCAIVGILGSDQDVEFTH